MLDRPLFRRLISNFVVAWLAGVVIAMAIALLVPMSLGVWDAAMIALLSGLVGLAGVLPFSSVAARLLGGPSIAEVLSGDLGRFVAFSIGMMIRIVGTVALFLLCRYHMASGTIQLAAWVLSWYVYLAVIEVIFFICLSSPKHESADCLR